MGNETEEFEGQVYEMETPEVMNMAACISFAFVILSRSTPWNLLPHSHIATKPHNRLLMVCGYVAVWLCGAVAM